MSDKYAFIEAEYAEPTCAPTIAQMCTWLSVSKSGYYEWRGRPPSPTATRREQLKIIIVGVFAEFDGTYGYRRVHAELLRKGHTVGIELVRRLMRELGLVACQSRPYKTTTTPDPEAAPTSDLVKRDFTAERPGTKLVGDITYIRTWQGWLYLATVIDCFNREVIGWAIADHMRTSLVIAAIEMAARNHHLEPGCIFHSDRGSQYTSAEYAATLQKLGIRRSVGRTGTCYDNALAESFNSSLKVERVHRTVYPTHQKAKADIANYIEIFYNRRRIHSALGYRTPHEVRTSHLKTQVAA